MWPSEDVRIGHVTKREGATGCTVIVVPQGAVAGVDVRGGAPGTREIALLDPVNTVERIHAVLLTGGSAFGLEAATGVMRYLEAQQIGFATPYARVPIVSAAVLYDLGIGDPNVRPDADDGYRAARTAVPWCTEQGNVGAGTGATVGKLRGMAHATKGGFGIGRCQIGDMYVIAFVAVNAVGEVVDETGGILAGIRESTPGAYTSSRAALAELAALPDPGTAATNTTIGCIVTNADLSKAEATKVAQMAHDGLARAIRPIHTPQDGDTLFALSVGTKSSSTMVVGALAADAVEQAVRQAVNAAESLAGIPCAADWQAARSENSHDTV